MFTVLFVIQVLYHMERCRLLPVTLLLVSAVEVSFTSNLTSSNAESNGMSSVVDWTLTREAILSAVCQAVCLAYCKQRTAARSHYWAF